MNQTIPFETAVMMFVQQHREKTLGGIRGLMYSDKLVHTDHYDYCGKTMADRDMYSAEIQKVSYSTQ